MKKVYYYIFLVLAIVAGCRKPYDPPAISAPHQYLVVEGIVNSGSDSTIIKLSRTVQLSGTTTANPELHAVLTVESDQNATYSLAEAGKGRYVSPGLDLDNDRNWRLRIRTANGEQYLSDFVPVQNAPPLDSVTYAIETNGVNFFVNTHDPKNNTHYYRWEFQETWRFHSDIASFFRSNGDTVLYRDLVNDNIYTCWRSDTSNSVIIGSSAKLSSDVISNSPLTFVQSTSIKLATEYSIIVKQYALTGAAYAFWQNLKQNTQQLGSIFDAQPTELAGNIHCISNPSLAVIGYLSVGSTTSQRAFLLNRNLPAWLPPPAVDTSTCGVMACLYQYYAPGSKIPVNQVNQYINYNISGNKNPLIPFKAIFSVHPSGIILGYYAAEPICVDCTLMGTNKQPPYWIYQ